MCVVVKYKIMAPFWAPNIYGTHKGTLVLTTTHVGVVFTVSESQVCHSNVH